MTVLKRMSFTGPTNYYDERIADIDAQICELLKRRKETSNHNPGYPPLEKISYWARKNNLYEEYLQSLFSLLRNEDRYRPIVEPEVFQKYIPVLKTVEVNGEMYTVTFIRQYNNASVVYLNVDSMPGPRIDGAFPKRHRQLELSIGEPFDCRVMGAQGTDDQCAYSFVISPSLPDDLQGLNLVFQEYTAPAGEPTGFKVSVELG